jgi:hypothetical protein
LAVGTLGKLVRVAGASPGREEDSCAGAVATNADNISNTNAPGPIHNRKVLAKDMRENSISSLRGT